jgi:hypothetical protein
LKRLEPATNMNLQHYSILDRFTSGKNAAAFHVYIKRLRDKPAHWNPIQA